MNGRPKRLNLPPAGGFSSAHFVLSVHLIQGIAEIQINTQRIRHNVSVDADSSGQANGFFGLWRLSADMARV
jgi:hypothetical protein